MKKLLLSLLPIALAACSFTRTTTTASSSSAPQKDATLVARRSGAYVALQPKGTLTLQLQSNPSAGYQWKLARPLDPNVLALASSPKAALPPIALPPAGLTVPQDEKWVFKAVQPGTTKVRMIYSRPDRPLSEAVTYEFTVNAE